MGYLPAHAPCSVSACQETAACTEDCSYTCTTITLTPLTPPSHTPSTRPSHTPPTPPSHSPLPHHHHTHPSHTTITLTPPTPPSHTPSTPPWHSPLPHHHHTHPSHTTITLTPPTPPVHLPGSPWCSGDTSTCHFCSCDHGGNTSKNTTHPPVAQPTATAPALSRWWKALLVVGPST